MTATKRQTLTRYLVALSWSVLLVAGTALFAIGGKWQTVGDNALGIGEIRMESKTLTERVTRLEVDLANIYANQQDMKLTLQRMDERQRSEYRQLIAEIRDGRADTPR